MWIFAQFVSYLRTAVLAMGMATLLFVVYAASQTNSGKAVFILFAVLVALILGILNALRWWKEEQALLRSAKEQVDELAKRVQLTSMERDDIVAELVEMAKGVERIQESHKKAFLPRLSQKIEVKKAV